MSKGTENSATLEWLDLRRLTEYAAVSERTLRTWIYSPLDPLPAACVGRKILVRRQAFNDWLERHQVKQIDVDVIVREMLEGVRGN